MNITIEQMKQADYIEVGEIYLQGIMTQKATFETEVPSYEKFDAEHTNDCRLVAKSDDRVIGWICLSSTSTRPVFKGVVEVSVYIHNDYKKIGIASRLMSELIEASEAAGYWSLESKIFIENKVSINLHRKFGFEVVGVRRKMGKDSNGNWRDVVVMERRSEAI